MLRHSRAVTGFARVNISTVTVDALDGEAAVATSAVGVTATCESDSSGARSGAVISVVTCLAQCVSG